MRELDEAYRATTYRTDTPSGAIDIRIGVASARLDRLLASRGVDRWAFITACNPHSHLLDAATNARLDAALRARLEELSHDFLPGEGLSDDGQWPAEPSLLVFAIDRDAAMAIGREFYQYAIVIGMRGGLPELVWLDAR